ncbi:MAG: 4-amino-4-deoxy-L-arabinose transferase, partial [Acidobacteria bacterium]|nr:4-amino-4-deoxy-L-arabinose transferase [Acidobacteriota bacterium]
RDDGAAGLARHAAAFAAGALLPGALLVPTLARFGINAGSGGVGRNLHPHVVNPWIIATTLARLLSFASLEISRFIATDGAKRLEFFARHLWLVPLAAVIWLIGLVQPLWMAVDACRPPRQWPAALPARQWAAMRPLVAASVLLVYASYWVVMEPPQAHAFYVLAPIALLFAAFWWTFVDSPRARRIAAAVLILNVVLHAGLAWTQGPELSLYKNRGVVAAAVRLKSPEMFAHRRDFAIDGGPAVLSDRSRAYDPTRDVQVLAAAFRMGPRRSLHWTITVHNASTSVAYRDPLYIAAYLDEGGAAVDERHERIKDVFQPGDTRTIELSDGFAGPAFATTRFTIVAAEALLPAP